MFSIALCWLYDPDISNPSAMSPPSKTSTRGLVFDSGCSFATLQHLQHFQHRKRAHACSFLIMVAACLPTPPPLRHRKRFVFDGGCYFRPPAPLHCTIKNEHLLVFDSSSFATSITSLPLKPSTRMLGFNGGGTPAAFFHHHHHHLSTIKNEHRFRFILKMSTINFLSWV